MPYTTLREWGDILGSRQNIRAQKIVGGTISSETIILASEQAVIRSENYDGTDGWAIFGDGTAYFGSAVTLGGDLYSSNWDGGFDLSSGADGTATAGWLLDWDSGAAQFQSAYFDSGAFTGTFEIDGGSIETDAAGNNRLAFNGSGIQFINSSDVVVNSLSLSASGAYFGDDLYVGGGVFAYERFLIDDDWAGVNAGPHYADFDIVSSFTGTGASTTGDQWTFQTEFIIDADRSGYLGGIPYTAFRVIAGVYESDGGGYSIWGPQTAFHDGSSTKPAITFNSDQDLGIYRIGTNDMGLSAGGLKLSIGNSRVEAEVPIRVQDGSAGTPSFAFADDTDNGFFRDRANRIVKAPLTTGGTTVGQTYPGLALGAGGMNTTSKWTAGLLFVSSDSAFTTVNPKVGAAIVGQALETYSADTDGGMGITLLNLPINPGANPNLEVAVRIRSAGNDKWIEWAGVSNDRIGFNTSTNQFSIDINGTQEMLLGSSGFYVPNVYNYAPGGGTANVIVDSAGRLYRVTSARKYKKAIKDASWLADIKLRPVSYLTKETETPYLGFIADELGEQDRRLGVWEDDEIEDLDLRAVVAVLAAKVNRLEAAQCACAVVH